MSDPRNTGEIEDVLSSIRRLVTEDEEVSTGASNGGDKLVLTPALRVAPEPPADAPLRLDNPIPPPEAPEGRAPNAVDAGKSGQPEAPFAEAEPADDDENLEEWLTELEAAVEERAGRWDNAKDDKEPEAHELAEAVEPEPDEATEARDVEDSSEDDTTEASAGVEAKSGPGADLDEPAPPEASTPEAEELAAEVGEILPETEESGSTEALEASDSGDRPDSEEPESLNTDAKETVAESISDAETAEPVQTNETDEEAPVIDAAPGNADDDIETVEVFGDAAGADAETEAATPQGRFDDWEPAEGVPQASGYRLHFGPRSGEATSPYRDPQSLADSGGPPEANVALPDAESLLDENELRALVAEVLREELKGALGERITRNVRKLVRREIAQALSSLDLD